MSLDVFLTYTIGRFPWQDAYEARYVIYTGKKQPARAKHLYIGKHRSADDSDDGFSFASLRKLGISVSDVTEVSGSHNSRSEKRICHIPFKIEGDRLFLVLGFNPAIPPDSKREILVKIRRRGVWKEIRKQGRDPSSSFTTAGVKTNMLRIRLSVPRTTLDPSSLVLVPSADFEDVGKVSSRRSDSGQGIEAVWDIDKPKRKQRYDYEVEFKPYGKLLTRLKDQFRLT